MRFYAGRRRSTNRVSLSNLRGYPAKTRLPIWSAVDRLQDLLVVAFLIFLILVILWPG